MSDIHPVYTRYPHPLPPFSRKTMKQNMLGIISMNKRRKFSFQLQVGANPSKYIKPPE
jgi:hypothetical protein